MRLILISSGMKWDALLLITGALRAAASKGFKHFLMYFPFPEQFGIVWEPPMMHRSFSDWCSLILQQENETWGWVASDTLLFGRLSSRHHCDKDDSKSETSCPGPLLQSTVLWICAHTHSFNFWHISLSGLCSNGRTGSAFKSGQLSPIEGRREISMLPNECQETSNYDMSGECDCRMKMSRSGPPH